MNPDDVVQRVSDLVCAIFDDAKTDEAQHNRIRKRIQSFLESRDPNKATLIFFVNANEAIDVDYAAPQDQAGELCFHVTKRCNPLDPVSSIQDLSHGTFVSSAKEVLDHSERSEPPDVLEPIVDAANELGSSLLLLQGRLPVPMDSFIADCEVAIDIERHAGACRSNVPHDDHLLQLEGYLDRWGAIIEDVLRTFDADRRVCEDATEHAGPLDAIAFWAEKKRILDSIYQQLQANCIRRILRCLDRAQTTKNYQFAKLCKRLFRALTEAKSNERFLRPLKNCFQKLVNEAQLKCLPQHFAPIFHILSLVWRTSDFFNTKPRLVVLLKELFCRISMMCHRHLSCGLPIKYVPASDSQEIVSKAKNVVRVLGKLKTTFASYKENSYSSCPGNAWDVSDHVLFVEVNRVLDRCHFMIELYSTSMQFSVLQGLMFGGGGDGSVLTAACIQLHDDFVLAFNDLEGVTKDLQPSKASEMFESEFYQFRHFLRDMDGCLKAIVCAGVDKCAKYLKDKLRLLSLLGGLVVERPMIFEAVATVVEELAGHFIDELNVLEVIFERGCDTSSFVLRMPPTASSVVWCRGLLGRATDTMRMFRALDARLLQGSRWRTSIQRFVRFEGVVAEFEQNEVIKLRHELDDPRLHDKLNIPILQRLLVNEASLPLELFKTTFDRMRERTAMESEYADRLGLELPPAARNVVGLWRRIRQPYKKIELIVSAYNRIQSTVETIERPLLRPFFEDLSTVLSSGLASSSDAVHWVSSMGALNALCQQAKVALQALVAASTFLHINLPGLDRRICSVRERLLYEHPPESLSLADASQFVRSTQEAAIEKHRAAVVEIQIILCNIRDATKPHENGVWDSFEVLIKTKLDAALAQSIELSLEELARSLDGRLKVMVDRDSITQWVSMILQSHVTTCSDSPSTSLCGPDLLSSPKVLSTIAKIYHLSAQTS